MLRKWGVLLFSVLAAIFLAVISVMPPAPKSADTPLNQFSSARAMTDIRVIAAKPHPTGSEENAKVRSYIMGRLSEQGMEVSVHKSKLSEGALARLNRWSGESKSAQTIYNIIGILPGQDRSKPALLLMAHHDTVWDSPGASDDTIGIASILEIIRAFNQSETQTRDLIVLITDAEELGLVGATNFFADHPLKDKVGAIINFEARGGGGTANMFQTSTENGEVAKLYSQVVKEPSASSLSTYVYNLLPNDTDLTPALKGSYIAYNIAHLGEAGYYHSPKIDADALEESTLQHMGSQGLDLTRAILKADDLPGKAPDVTFFDLFGLFTISYAPFWGWIFLAIGGLGYALSVGGEIKTKNIFRGFIRMSGFLIIGALVLFSLNLLSGHDDTANYYDRLAAIPRLEIIALVTCLAAYLFILGRRRTNRYQRLGAALPIFVLGIIGQVMAPTATYFISIPLFLTGLAAFALNRTNRGFIGQSIAALSVILVVGYMLSLAHLLLLGVGPDLLFVAILPAAIAALALLPFPCPSKKTRNRLATLGMIAAIGIAMWVRLDPVAATVPTYQVW